MNFSQAQRRIVESVMESEWIPGVAAAIVKDGEIIAAEGFGYRNLEQKLPMTPQTVSPICSLTKSFTATSVMQLVESGKLALDEPVQSYIPSLRIADEETTRKITPRILLSHKSGMGRTGHQPKMFEQKVSPYKDRGDLVSRLADVRLQTPPNVAWSYCNEGFATVGFLVETVGGIPLEEYFETRIFQPVGMDKTYTSFAQWRDSDDRTHQYAKESDGYKETSLPENYSIYLSTGGICSTANDLARYLIASMDYENSPLVSAGSFDQMHSISMPFGDTGMGYGLGWRIRLNDDRKIVSHGGGLPGVSTHFLIVPSEKVGVVALTNLDGASAALIAEQLADSVLDRPLYRANPQGPIPLKTRYVVPQDRLTDYAGTYEFGELKVEVSLENGGLKAIRSSNNGGESDVSLMTGIGDDLFLAQSILMRQEGTPIHFVRGNDGKVSSLLTGGSQLWRV